MELHYALGHRLTSLLSVALVRSERTRSVTTLALEASEQMSAKTLVSSVGGTEGTRTGREESQVDEVLQQHCSR